MSGFMMCTEAACHQWTSAMSTFQESRKITFNFSSTVTATHFSCYPEGIRNGFNGFSAPKTNKWYATFICREQEYHQELKAMRFSSIFDGWNKTFFAKYNLANYMLDTTNQLMDCHHLRWWSIRCQGQLRCSTWLCQQQIIIVWWIKAHLEPFIVTQKVKVDLAPTGGINLVYVYMPCAPIGQCHGTCWRSCQIGESR